MSEKNSNKKKLEEKVTKPVKVSLIDKNGKASGEFEVKGEIFDRVIKTGSVHSSIVYTRNKARSGTHSTINKGEMEATGKKPWKQKGTGRARSGTSSSPIWVGGAVAHGPKPRSYAQSMNKKDKAVALSIVLTEKLKTGSLKVIANESDFALKTPKTKEASQFLKNLGIDSNKTLVVLNDSTSDNSKQIIRAYRNLSGLKVTTYTALNTFDLLKFSNVICSKESLEGLQNKVANVLGY